MSFMYYEIFYLYGVTFLSVSVY